MIKLGSAASIEKRNKKALRLYVKEMAVMKTLEVIDALKNLKDLNDGFNVQDIKAKALVNRIEFF